MLEEGSKKAKNEKIKSGINPIYAELGRSCPRDSKNVSYVDVALV